MWQLSPHRRDNGHVGKVQALQGYVNLEAPGEMSSLQLVCEGLGFPRAVWAGVSLAVSTLPTRRMLVAPSSSTSHPFLDLFPFVPCVIVHLPRKPTTGSAQSRG